MGLQFKKKRMGTNRLEITPQLIGAGQGNLALRLRVLVVDSETGEILSEELKRTFTVNLQTEPEIPDTSKKCKNVVESNQ